MQSAAEPPHHRVAQNGPSDRGSNEAGLRTLRDEVEMIRREGAHRAPEQPEFAAADDVDERARVDADRAGGGTEAVARAEVASDTAEVARQLLRPTLVRGIRRRRETGDFPLHDDALAGRHREAVRHAVHLAETALDAAVHQGMDLRERLQMGDVGRGVLVEDHAGVEDVLGVEERLHVLHQLVGGIAPFPANERRHVASGAVLGLERAMVLVHDERHDGAHHRIVLGDRLLAVEALVEDEVPVALEGVSVDDGVRIVVLDEQTLQIDGEVGEVGHGDGDILDQTRGADLARAADRRKDAAAHRPVLADERGVGREGCRRAERTPREHRLELDALRRQLVQICRLGLHQDRTRVVGEALQFGEIRLDDAHGAAVEELRGRERPRRLHLGHGLAGGARGGEEQQGGLRDGGNHARAHRNLGEERQRPLAARQQVGDDVERIVELDEREDRQARHVLDRVFAADEIGERGIRPRTVAQFEDARDEAGMRRGEGVARRGAARVKHRTIRQDQPRALEHAIGVGVRAAAHAGRVVVHNAADHRALHRGGVRREETAKGAQNIVDPLSDDTRLETDPRAVLQDFMALPILPADDEQRVAGGLTRQRRAGRAEGDRLPLRAGAGEDVQNPLLIRRHQDLLR